MPKSKKLANTFDIQFLKRLFKRQETFNHLLFPLFCRRTHVTPNGVWVFVSLYLPGFSRDLLVPSKPCSSRSRSRGHSPGQRQQTAQRFQVYTRCTGDQRRFPGGNKKPSRCTLEFLCQLQGRCFFLEEKIIAV